MSSEDLHAPRERLTKETIHMHQAIVSLMEELEAIDWYQQRVDATADEDLKTILMHNRDEEKEHAAMLLEWLRRRDASLDQQLRNYLFMDKPVLEREEELDQAEAGGAQESDGSLGIGSLHGNHAR